MMDAQASTQISASLKAARYLYRSERFVRKALCFGVAIPLVLLLLLGKLLFPGNDALGYLMIPLLPFIALAFGLHLLLVVATWPLMLSPSVRQDPEISTTSLPNTLGRMHSVILVALLAASAVFS